ncbi:MAG: tetratricopeptide repeat protein [Treponema sp.]|jgi:Flp pilus assembly protein TadD|nr:tetratricopeptide repeat protein [Treponema sp.]
MVGTIQEGIRLFNMKRWELAIQEFLEALTRVNPEDETLSGDLAYYLGLCYTKLEQFDEALLYLEQVVTGTQNAMRMYQCRITLAYIYVITKRSKMAESELARLAETGFESVQLYTILAYTAWADRQYQKAVDLYKKALQLDNNNATAINGLGYILVDTAMDPQNGLLFCKKAVDINPKNPSYLDSLGWAYFKTGNHKEAVNWLRRALDLAPQQKEIRNHIKIVAGEAG